MAMAIKRGMASAASRAAGDIVRFFLVRFDVGDGMARCVRVWEGRLVRSADSCSGGRGRFRGLGPRIRLLYIASALRCCCCVAIVLQAAWGWQWYCSKTSVKWCEDNTRAEWLCGEVMVSPPTPLQPQLPSIPAATCQNLILLPKHTPLPPPHPHTLQFLQHRLRPLVALRIRLQHLLEQRLGSRMSRRKRTLQHI
jgi:hypothetical protein